MTQGRPLWTWGARTLAVLRHEWRALTGNRLILVFQGTFLVALSALIFLVADFYASDTASPVLLATFLPWVALIFVPALAMSILSEESGDRELELLSTLPMRRSSIVAGKWLARCAILAVTLALTFPFPLTVAYLGEPDWGRVAAVYLGGVLLLSTLLAIALFSASIFRDQIGAFVAALATLFVLIALGWDSTIRLLPEEHAFVLLGLLESVSPKYWFDRIASGRIELAALVYFLAVPILALWGASAVLELRNGASLATRQTAVRIGKGLAAVLISGFVIAGAERIDLAFDATDEREYSLDEATKKVVDRVPAETVIDLYWSSSTVNVPTSIREHARRVTGLLEAMVAQSGGRLRLNRHVPTPESDEEFSALKGGVMLVPMSSGDSFMLGATVQSGERQSRIAYFDLSRERLLEYDIALMLEGLGKPRVARVAVLSPLVLPRHARDESGSLTVIDELRRAYDVAVVPLFADSLPADIDALVVIDATLLKREMLCAIDRHVMEGKGLVVLMDPRVRSLPSSSEVAPQPSEEINDISDLLLRYGLRYEFADVVGDEALATPVADSAGRQFQYPFWITVGADQIASAESVTAGLRTLLFPEPGHFTLTGGTAVPLVRTTGTAGVLPRAGFDSSTAEIQTGRFKADQSGDPLVIGALARGSLPSAFSTPCTTDHGPHIERSKASARVFAVADVDWIFDTFAFQTDAGPQRIPLNDNATLFLNMVEAATGDGTLIGIRSRGPTRRSFTRVAALVQAASRSHSARIGELETRIARVESNISQIPSAAGVESLDQLPPDLKKRVDTLRQDLLPLRRELRDLRKEIRRTAEDLGRRLTLANLAAGPLLVLVQWALFGWLSHRRLKGRQNVARQV